MITVRPLRVGDAAAMAEVHASAFDDPWSGEDIAVLLAAPGAFALGAGAADDLESFVLCRLAADEAEVLTIATRPDARRRGAAAAVLAEALVVALASGAAAMFLEVATDNPAAQALYASQGFVEVGRRPAYYARVQGPAAGALIMRRDLNR